MQTKLSLSPSCKHVKGHGGLKLNLIADQVPDTLLRRYCYQIVHRCVESGGEYRDIEQGFPEGARSVPCSVRYISRHWMTR